LLIIRLFFVNTRIFLYKHMALAAVPGSRDAAWSPGGIPKKWISYCTTKPEMRCMLELKDTGNFKKLQNLVCPLNK
jgi:hypothetical protein